MAKKTATRTYEISLNRRHPSGVGAIYLRKQTITEKPSFDNCDFYDETNREWARYVP